MNHIIALYSPAPQSGKTTTADYLNLQGYTVVKFAGILKDMVRTMLLGAGIPLLTVERMVEGDLKEFSLTLASGVKVTPRRLMQTLGTEWGRGIDPDLWASLTAAKIKQMVGRGQKVVIDDMRFPNEFDAITKIGGATVCIHRSTAEVVTGHSSEGQLNDHFFDAVLINDGTIADLHQQIRERIK